jgi:hypothetical protein
MHIATIKLLGKALFGKVRSGECGERFGLWQ